MLVKSVLHNKYAFYDLAKLVHKIPQHDVSINPSTREGTKKKLTSSSTSRAFEGNYSGIVESKEDIMNKIFGGRIKGEPPKSSSRILRSEPKKIAGVLVPAKPLEPDNCCMSGCINCVWELFNDDLKDWNTKRKEAALLLVKKGGRWPQNFDAPVKYLGAENLPVGMQPPSDVALSKKATSDHSEDGWNNVPMSIRVFAEMEKKMKAKRNAQAL